MQKGQSRGGLGNSGSATLPVAVEQCCIVGCCSCSAEEHPGPRYSLIHSYTENKDY